MPVTVADDLLCGEPPVLGDRREAEVYMRAFLVHVDNGGENVVPADLPGHELRCPLKEGFDLGPLLSFEEAGAGGDERVHKSHAVFAGLAARRRYAVVALPPVGRYRLDDVEVAAAPCGVNLRVTGVFFLCPLMVSLQSAEAALLFGEPQDCVLGDRITPSLPSCNA